MELQSQEALNHPISNQGNYRHVEIVATLAGERLYAAGGYEVPERFEIPLKATTSLPVVRLARNW